MSTHHELSVRREIERPLFAIGLSFQDIATALGIDSSSVKNDYDLLGGKSTFPQPELSQAERRTNAYAQAFLKYSQLGANPAESDLSTVNSGLSQALANYLDAKRLRAIAEGIAAIIQELRNPTDPPEYKAYRKLLQAVYGGARDVSGEMLFTNFLKRVSLKKDVVVDRKTFAATMGSWALEMYHETFTLPLNQEVLAVVGDVMKTLSPREEKILRMRFGIGYEQMSLEKIGEHFNVSRDRIRQIEAKALRKLRHPSRSWYLHPFASLHFAAGWCFEHIFPKLPVEPEPPAPNSDTLTGLLNISVEELEVSVRTYNCLKNANLQSVGDIVQKTESEIERFKNFGRKSIRELREILDGLGGLRFGMMFNKFGEFTGYRTDPE